MAKDLKSFVANIVRDAFIAEGIDPSFAIITKSKFPYVDFHTAGVIAAAKSMGIDAQELADRVVKRIQATMPKK